MKLVIFLKNLIGSDDCSLLYIYIFQSFFSPHQFADGCYRLVFWFSGACTNRPNLILKKCSRPKCLRTRLNINENEKS